MSISYQKAAYILRDSLFVQCDDRRYLLGRSYAPIEGTARGQVVRFTGS